MFGQLLAFPPSGGAVQLLSNAQYELANPDSDPNDNYGVTAITVDPTTNQVVLAAGLRGKIVNVDQGKLVPIVGKNFTSSLEPTDPTIMWKVDHMAFGADGLLYFTENYLGIREAKLRRVEPSFPGKSLSDTNYQLPSPDGGRVYHFDGTGQLLDCRATGSDDPIYTYSYTQGWLTGITDRYNNTTRVVRASDGTIQQIVAPFGQTTTIRPRRVGSYRQSHSPRSNFLRLHLFGQHEPARVDEQRAPRYCALHVRRRRSPADQDRRCGWWGYLALVNSATHPVTTTEGVVQSYNFDHSDSSLDRTVTFADGTHNTSSETASGDSTLGHDDGTTIKSTLAADPIWGMARPYTSKNTVELPSGLTSTSTMAVARPHSVPTILSERTAGPKPRPPTVGPTSAATTRRPAS